MIENRMPSSQHTLLQYHLNQFANLTEADAQLASEFWTLRTIPKHDFFNFRNSVCRHVGFIVKGIFRVYYLDPKTEKEHNLVFANEHMFLASLKSMVTQTACPYAIEALEDAELLVIQHDHLQVLYGQSHGWSGLADFWRNNI
jgi:CRP-like cAMP-binding protein